VLRQDPFSGHLFIFRGRAAHTIKVLMYDGSGFLLRLFLDSGVVAVWS